MPNVDAAIVKKKDRQTNIQKQTAIKRDVESFYLMKVIYTFTE